MTYSAIVACGLAEQRRWLPGQEENCIVCGARIFVSDDTRAAAGDEPGFACVPCALEQWGGETVTTSPKGHAVAEAFGVTHFRGRKLV